MSSSIQQNAESSQMARRTPHHRNVENSPLPESPTPIPTTGPDIVKAKHVWFEIQEELPPQISKQNIRMISFGGVIGTGLFLGISQSLRDGGPIGMVIGYAITGTIVYAVVVSLAEMVAFLPNVGGPVGLADLYVDEALGFAMGWNAWYNWTIVLPAELSAAAIIASYYVPQIADPEQYNSVVKKLSYATTSVLLVAAVAINFLGRYGDYEFYFAAIKIATIVVLIIVGIAIDNLHLKTATITPPQSLSCIPDVFDPTVTKMKIGSKYLFCPGAFVQYKGIPGATGRVLGIWSVLMQAIFSYCGSEIPAIAGAEVENPGENIPSVVKWIWWRISLFYVLGVFIAGLLVPYNHPGLSPKDSNNGIQYVQSSPFIIAMQVAGIRILPYITSAFFLMSAWSAATSDVYISSRFLFFLAKRGHAPRFLAKLISRDTLTYAIRSAWNGDRMEEGLRTRGPKRLVIPIFGVLTATIFAFLAFLPSQSPSAEQAFYWLSSMTSAAAMLSWTAMMVTYVRWNAGIKYAESQEKDFKNNHPELYPRPWFQPYLAWYAIVMCTAILLLHGWAVFTIDAVRRIAIEPGDLPPATDPILGNTFVLTFVTSYLPIPLFLLCIFGYKLIKQTSYVELHEMDFNTHADELAVDHAAPSTLCERLANMFVP